MVGTAMAAAVAKIGAFKNKKVLLLEGAPEKDYPVGSEYGNRVSALNPGTVQLLDSLGAWELMQRVRVKPVQKMQVWESCSEAAITFSNDDNPSEPLNHIVENDVTQNALNEVVKRFTGENLTVMYQSKVRSYELPSDTTTSNLPEDPVRINLENGDVIEAELLVGADGFKSLCRTTMGCQYVGWDYHQMGIVATLELAGVTPGDRANETAWQRFLPTGPIAVLPLSPTRSSLVWSLDTPLAKELIQLDEDGFVDRLNKGLHDMPATNPVVDAVTTGVGQVLAALTGSGRQRTENPPVIKSAKLRAAFPFGFGHSTRYCGPRCVLIGDAAHRIHPLAGQGVNLGFGDVASLARIVEASIIDGAGLGHHDYLRQYETERQQHNVPTMLGCDGLQKIYNTDFAPVVMARSLGLQAVNAVGPVKKFFVARAA